MAEQAEVDTDSACFDYSNDQLMIGNQALSTASFTRTLGHLPFAFQNAVGTGRGKTILDGIH
ncbi:hypothetical protein CMQ_3457 [Grosmannia clavigera kw1407]|uniref:Uncharacterized protein n=1 Tax=Grosmannia clavigera (strain kw1407 / UAMH 11150) TaxID=655863 RepID=F0X908_GROCL|nr:uncharacterized protein CMQ_3457 [Grosmannia clavigera kw1407]EFX05388.1 hypothetical protein CMQ_3457 [Grosmannia clavigera kw1407]